MGLSQEPFDNVYLDLVKVQQRIRTLKLLGVRFGSNTIIQALFREHASLTAESVGANSNPPTLSSDGTTWVLTSTQAEDWRLAAPMDGLLRPSFMSFLLVPCMQAAVITKTMAVLDGHLPYLEIAVDKPLVLAGRRTTRGLYITALALLQSLIPEDI